MVVCHAVFCINFQSSYTVSAYASYVIFYSYLSLALWIIMQVHFYDNYKYILENPTTIYRSIKYYYYTIYNINCRQTDPMMRDNNHYSNNKFVDITLKHKRLILSEYLYPYDTFL